MFELLNENGQQAEIKVFGVGGGGGNAVDYMIQNRIEGVDFITANTDSQALDRSAADHILQIGTRTTKGLGAGADPAIGKEAAEEDSERIRQLMEGADMVFVTAGMGGGTGTGAAPIVAGIAKQLNILTVAVVTTPFPFEGAHRMALATKGMDDLRQQVDSLIVVPNAKLLEMNDDMTLIEAFAEGNKVLHGAVQGIAELITRAGLINVDFADVKAIMSSGGMSMMGTGTDNTESRAEVAAHKAICSPLLEDIEIKGARGILVNVTAGMDMKTKEFEAVGQVVRDFAADDANIVMGTVLDPNLEDGHMRVTIVATGVEQAKPDAAKRRAPVKRERVAIARPGVSAGKDAGAGQPASVAPDYSEYDIPTIERNAGATSQTTERSVAPAPRAQAVKSTERGAKSVIRRIPSLLRNQAN